LIENQTKTGVFVGAVDPIAQVCILRLQAPVSSNCSAVDFENHLCSTGETGEILVAGEHVLNTYLRSEEIFEKNKIVVGKTIWHRTGDAGYLLNNGALFLMGRAHQIFTADQVQVYPFVAEKLLRELAGVRLGTIIQHNNQPVLVYQADHDMEESSLRAIFPQVPLAKIIRLKEIPVDPRHRSKIEYVALKNLIQL
jgi:acyl-CoA synthetase (AMP-forming)/AMP-acid ligase II